MVYVPEADQFAATPKPSEEHEYDSELGEWVIPGFTDSDLQVENVGESN
jgi:hypothetical protein